MTDKESSLGGFFDEDFCQDADLRRAENNHAGKLPLTYLNSVCVSTVWTADQAVFRLPLISLARPVLLILRVCLRRGLVLLASNTSNSR